jgi:hypothetical protein
VDLLGDDLIARDHRLDRAGDVRERALPAVQQREVGVGALHATPGAGLDVDDVGGHKWPEPVPVGVVERVDQRFRDAGELGPSLRHGSLLSGSPNRSAGDATLRLPFARGNPKIVGG